MVSDKLKSRKFWLALLVPIVMILNTVFDWSLNPELIAMFIIPIIAYIFGESWIDATRIKTNNK